jgi:hypothetical protein
MRGKGLITLTVGWIGVVGIVPTSAHHAFSAEFDGNRPVTLRGKVVKMEWVNPHSWITMDVKRDNGKLERWDVEAGAPNALFRRGFRKDSLVPGTEIVIEGYQAKSGKNMANGRDITFTDGRKLFMGSSGTGAPYDKNKKPE